MPYTYTLSDIIPATPEAIYAAWLDSRGHSDMTGAKATASAEVGGAFTAWDGYISGRNVQLIPNVRIVQTWRTTAMAPAQQYSVLTVMLAPVAGGTRVTIVHANVPDDHKGYQDGGWQQYYFTPMKAYFGGAKRVPKPPAKKAAPRAPAKAAPAKAKAAKPKAAKAKSAKRKTVKAKARKAAVKKTKAVKRKTSTAKARSAKARPARRKMAARTAAKRKSAPRRAAKRKAAKRK